MSVLEDIVRRVRVEIDRFLESIGKKVLGANNERLDFAMDSFYKLPDNARLGVMAVIGGGLGVVVLSAFWLYFSQIHHLERDLNIALQAHADLKELKANDAAEDKRFSELRKLIKRKTSSLRIKPFFEKLSRSQSVTVEGLTEETVDFPKLNPLSDFVSELHADMRMPKISIPRLLRFLIEIEKSSHLLRVQTLEVRGRFGTRLYFDGEVEVRGYQVRGAS
ncbi:MAG: hypothetical protein AB8C84_04295 [Oligoflexales bacterium]